MHHERLQEKLLVAGAEGVGHRRIEAYDHLPPHQGDLVLMALGEQAGQLAAEMVPLAPQQVVGRQVRQLGVVNRPANLFCHVSPSLGCGFYPKAPPRYTPVWRPRRPWPGAQVCPVAASPSTMPER